MSGLLVSGTFVALSPTLVRETGGLGPAAVLQYVHYRQPRNGDPAAIPVEDFVRDIGISDSTVKRQTRKLEDDGLLIKHQDGRNGVVSYAVNREHPILTGVSPCPREGANLTPSSSPIEDQEQTSVADASGPVLALVSDPTEEGLFAAPESDEEPWPTEATPDGIRRAWIGAYTTAHGAPDPTIKRRAFGIIKSLVKDRESLDDWRALWTAAVLAGEAGRFDVAAHLGPVPTSQFLNRHNAYVHMLNRPPRPSPATLLGQMLDDRPAAITRGP